MHGFCTDGDSLNYGVQPKPSIDCRIDTGSIEIPRFIGSYIEVCMVILDRHGCEWKHLRHLDTDSLDELDELDERVVSIRDR